MLGVQRSEIKEVARSQSEPGDIRGVGYPTCAAGYGEGRGHIGRAFHVKNGRTNSVDSVDTIWRERMNPGRSLLDLRNCRDGVATI